MTAKQAREFISTFSIVDQGRADFIETDDGRRIEFASMTDDDAITAASLLADLQVDIQIRKGEYQ